MPGFKIQMVDRCGALGIIDYSRLPKQKHQRAWKPQRSSRVLPDSFITISCEDTPSVLMFNRIKKVLRGRSMAENHLFVDYRPGTLEDMSFIPMVQVRGDIHNEIECWSCGRQVKEKSCSFVISSRDNEPFSMCQACCMMIKLSEGGIQCHG